VGVLGSNNAGKTTLIRAITGSLPAWEGSIIFNGVDISKYPVEKIIPLGVGVALEGRRIFASLSVEENLLLPMPSKASKGNSSRKKLLAEIYDVMPDLWRHRNASGSALSGGQQQMLAIGRALMVEPQLLVLDEPSLGLSPRFTEHVVELLRSINSRYQMAILIAEQLVWIASEVSSKVYVMSSGELGEERKRGEWSERDLSDAYLGGAGDSGDPSPG
jgi:branched-chain amino acid transport system ATP-binding protein